MWNVRQEHNVSMTRKPKVVQVSWLFSQRSIQLRDAARQHIRISLHNDAADTRNGSFCNTQKVNCCSDGATPVLGCKQRVFWTCDVSERFGLFPGTGRERKRRLLLWGTDSPTGTKTKARIKWCNATVWLVSVSVSYDSRYEVRRVGVCASMYVWRGVCV